MTTGFGGSCIRVAAVFAASSRMMHRRVRAIHHQQQEIEQGGVERHLDVDDRTPGLEATPARSKVLRSPCSTMQFVNHRALRSAR